MAVPASADGSPRAILPSTAQLLDHEVGLAADGEATVVWERGTPPPSQIIPAAREVRIQAATVTPGSGVGRLQLLARVRSANGTSLELGVSPGGRALAMWTGDDGRIRYATRSSGTRFGPARRFGHRGYVYRVVPARNGEFHVVWSSGDTLHVVTGSPRAGFGDPAKLSARGSSWDDFEFNPGGTMMVITELDRVGVRIWLRSPGGRFRRAGQIVGGSSGAAAVLRPDGSIVALSSGCGPDDETGICEQIRPPGGEFSRARVIAKNGAFAQPAVDARGRMTALWDLAEQNGGVGGVALATAQPGHGFGRATRVVGHGGSNGGLAVGPGGRRLMTWYKNAKGGRHFRLHAASWSARSSPGSGRTLDSHDTEDEKLAVAHGRALVVWTRQARNSRAGRGLFYSFVTPGD